MNNLTKALMEELTVEYVKVGPMQIPESVVISWVILAIVTIGSILLTRNLKVDHISKRQAVLEMAYLAGTNFFEGLLGEKGRRYVPYLMTVAIYIATVRCASKHRGTKSYRPNRTKKVLHNSGASSGPVSDPVYGT